MKNEGKININTQTPNYIYQNANTSNINNTENNINISITNNNYNNKILQIYNTKILGMLSLLMGDGLEFHRLHLLFYKKGP